MNACFTFAIGKYYLNTYALLSDIQLSSVDFLGCALMRPGAKSLTDRTEFAAHVSKQTPFIRST